MGRKLTPEQQAALDALNATVEPPAAPPAPEPGFFDKLGSGARDALGKAGSFMEGVNRGFSGGIITKGTDMWDQATPESFPKFNNDYFRKLNPDTNTVGHSTGVAGSALVGPGAAAAKGSQAAIEAVVPRLAAKAAERGVGAAAARTAIATGTGAASGGELAALDGGNVGEGALYGGVSGGGLHAGGEAVNGLYNLLGKALPWMGRYQAAAEPSTPEIEFPNGQKLPPGPNRLEAPAVEHKAGKLPTGPKGIAKAGAIARDEINASDARQTAEAGAKWRERVDPVRERPLNMTPVREELLKSGVGSRPLSAAVNDVDALTPPSGYEPQNAPRIPGRAFFGAPGAEPQPTAATIPAGGVVGETPIPGVPQAALTPATGRVANVKSTLDNLRNNPTVGDALDQRAVLDEQAGWGSPSPTPEQHAARSTRAALRAGIRESSPLGVAQADDEFAQFRQVQNRRNDIMYGKEQGPQEADALPPTRELPPDMAEAPPPLRVGDEQAAATRLGYLGDDSTPGARWAPYLEELSAQHPDFKAALDDLMGRKAFLASRFGVPEMPTSLPKAVAWPARFVSHNVQAGAMRGMPPVAKGLKGLGRLAPRLRHQKENE